MTGVDFRSSCFQNIPETPMSCSRHDSEERLGRCDVPGCGTVRITGRVVKPAPTSAKAIVACLSVPSTQGVIEKSRDGRPFYSAYIKVTSLRPSQDGRACCAGS